MNRALILLPRYPPWRLKIFVSDFSMARESVSQTTQVGMDGQSFWKFPGVFPG